MRQWNSSGISRRPLAILPSTAFRSKRAATVFGDPLAMTFFDPDHSDDEDRFLTFGHSDAGRLLVVSHTDRDERTRIISARTMTRKERKQHEEED
jgi:uncharacterized DUF497 family protein